MNLYSNKQRWKILLLLAATLIIGVTLWYSNRIASRIKNDERKKVELWSEAVQKKAKLVAFTEDLFEQLRNEERRKANLYREAFEISSQPVQVDQDFTFVASYLFSNTTIPTLWVNDDGRVVSAVNLPENRKDDPIYLDSLKQVIQEKDQIIEMNIFGDQKQYMYYNDSRLFEELQIVMEDLINSFISETVINSASVPVVLVDSARQQVVSYGGIDSFDVNNKVALNKRLETMAASNAPISIDLADRGKHFIYFENSLILDQLRYYPLIQLILIAVFLLVAYLIFSTFRRGEQNQVWVGMAKETAHQLGTPLSSLMAWTALLEAEGVPQETLDEINKDLDRLNTVTDRFSKIGSKAELKDTNVVEFVKEILDYLRLRLSKKVIFQFESNVSEASVMLNESLFSWVIENLSKNAVDAMEGVGQLSTHISLLEDQVTIDISDTGKGIPKGKQKTVFQPGYTTKKRGWGLGLSLVKRIVEEYHGGKIFVKESSPSGTTFRIVFKTND